MSRTLGGDVIRRDRTTGAWPGVEGYDRAETETGEQRAAIVREQDVRGLDVAVDGGS
jgi:hypothetical protein